MREDKFSAIRPYNDAEARLAFGRIARSPYLKHIADLVFPQLPFEEVQKVVSSLESVDQFQTKIMLHAINWVVNKTVKELTYSGLDGLKDGKPRLLISNHRDITLDSAIVQVILHTNNLKTSEMAVGDNLITDPFTEDVARSNKMIKVIRKANPKEIYNSSLTLSNYIRKVILEKDSSVWIAQRNGRTKDGIDLTENALLKMLAMSGSGNFEEDFLELSITPIAISYQYEPCDFLKAQELFHSRRGCYVKDKGEDLNSVLTGLKQWKGNLHIHFCDPIEREVLEGCDQLDKNGKFKKLAQAVDSKIYSNYKLWENNYIAHDLLTNSDSYREKYSESSYSKFKEYFKEKCSQFKGERDEIEEIEELFLSIYANPVKLIENKRITQGKKMGE